MPKPLMLKCKTEPVTQLIRTLLGYAIVFTALTAIIYLTAINILFILKILGLVIALMTIHWILPKPPEPTTKAGVIHQTIPGAGVVIIDASQEAWLRNPNSDAN